MSCSISRIAVSDAWLERVYASVRQNEPLTAIDELSLIALVKGLRQERDELIEEVTPQQTGVGYNCSLSDYKRKQVWAKIGWIVG